MAKRHHSGPALLGQIRRCQELILARSGVDDFYEAIRLLVAKSLHEKNEQTGALTYKIAQEILEQNAPTVVRFVDDGVKFASPEEVIDECFQVLRPTILSSAGFEALDAAFEAMTSREAKSDKGQFFTPRHVVQFCIEVLRPKKGELICDPACGSAAFLKAAYDFTGQTIGSLYGFDISRRAAMTSELMSFLACDDRLSIDQLDSLAVTSSELISTQRDELRAVMESKAVNFKGFDVIATNPPFAGDVGSSEYAEQYQLGRLAGKRVERDVLFIERCVDLLRPGGRLAIVLPDNKVSSQRFSEVRRWLLEKMQVVSVVSLHGYTFRPYTSQKAVVVFATKPKKPVTQAYPIAFYQSIKPGKTSSGDLVLVGGQIDHDLTLIREDMEKTWTL